MNTSILSDAVIGELILEAKTIPDGLCPLTKQIERNQHQRRDFEIVGAQGSKFVLATRQSMLNVLDFSAILGYKMPGFNTVFRLRRYNGKSHEHTNAIENEKFRAFHIHKATERYQRNGRKEDHFATIDTRFYNLQSAVHCLLFDCGFPALPFTQMGLFPNGPIQ
ncbi:MAG: hypothetical protein ACR2JE_09050 [Acidobacteriaceae bacterium]